ncbi:cullin 3 [Artemisia annua]|uniref:Cullin 3 n=1 Tax=Artemisia annua TaxID=35608 RepID=A0A2U1LVQ7_ARTAN|nr:cullin 3 [Artemisia annua]
MVLHKFGEKLYSGLVSTMTSHLKEIALSIEASQGALFLEELDRKWTEHNKALQMIRDILMYMDRTFVPSTHRTPVHELGLNLWRVNIVHTVKIQLRLKDTLLELVQKERGGEVINRGLMRNIMKMLIGSSVYQEDFEKPFLAVSADFYRGESQLFIESCDCGNYLKKAEKRLNEEIERVAHYLDARSEFKITNVVEKEMIESQMTRLVQMENSGLVNMLVDDKYEDLGRMYNLFRRVPNGLTSIRDVMTVHLRETGRHLVSDGERLKDPVDFVQRLLDIKDKHDKIINLAFNNDKMFQNALNSSFEYFINLNTRSPEFISLFVDDKLRKGLKGVSEEDVEIVLDKVMMLFRYLQEKDVFEKYYKQHLAKRLLSAMSVSEDAERCLILKLKTECGYQFTSKLEGMLTDMKTSDDTFFFNDKFSSKFYEVKIGTVAAQKESEPEKQETRQRVEEDRN